MSSAPPVFDVRTRELFSTLVARAKEQSLSLTLDFNASRALEHWWLVQLFSHDDSTLITGRGESFAVAVAAAYDRFFALTMQG